MFCLPLDLRHEYLSRVLECLHAGAAQLADLLTQFRAILGLAHVYQHIAEKRHMTVDLHDELEDERRVNKHIFSTGLYIFIRVIDSSGCLIYARALLGPAHSTLRILIYAQPSPTTAGSILSIFVCPTGSSARSANKFLGNSLAR